MSRWFIILQLSALLLVTACRFPAGHEGALRRFEFEEPQMGVPFRIVFYAANENIATNAAERAFSRVAELNAIMSDYETDSELSRLSRSSEQGSPEVPVSPDLWHVLSTAQKLARDSDGAFDVTVGPCSALWRKARREKELPNPARQLLALSKVGFTNLVLNEQRRTVRLLKAGMRLDLGAIAKGYAADETIQILRQSGVTRALVAASGDLAIGEPPPGKTGWSVSLVEHGSTTNRTQRLVLLKNCGVATSGDLFQFLDIAGTRYSHILDPFTCVGMTNHALATVIARNCMMADAIDTTLTILPQKQGAALARKYDVAARVVRIEEGRPVEYSNRRFQRLIGMTGTTKAP